MCVRKMKFMIQSSISIICINLVIYAIIALSPIYQIRNHKTNENGDILLVEKYKSDIFPQIHKHEDYIPKEEYYAWWFSYIMVIPSIFFVIHIIFPNLHIDFMKVLNAYN